MSTVAVVGGGISGLSSAYYLTKQFANSKITKILVLESSKRLGGWIQTTHTEDGAVFEHGPRTFRPAGKSGYNTLQLVEELGLTDKIIGIPKSHDAAKNRYIYMDEKLHALPNGAKGLFVAQPPFRRPLLGTIVKELFTSKSGKSDESIHRFVERRLSKEFVDYLFNPMFRGIFAGDIKQLSIRSCLPDVYEAERKHGSIIKGLFMASKDRQVYLSHLIAQAKSEHWAMWSLQNGLQELTSTLVDNLKKTGQVDISLNSPVKKIDFKDGKAMVHTDSTTIQADHVICSTLSKNLSGCLSPDHQKLKDELNKIYPVSCVVVNVEYGEEVNIKPGFGHLLPSTEDGPVLGVIYDSCALKQHNRKGQPSSRFTLMLGGAWFDELKKRLGSLDEDVIRKFAVDTLSRHLNISAQPTRVIVSIQKDCIPQYLVGHYDTVNHIFDYISDHKLPLSLVGSSYRGVSLNDCIYNAKLEVERLAKHF